MKKFLLAVMMICGGVLFAQSDTTTTNGPAHPPTIVVKAPMGKRITMGDYSIELKKIVDSRCPADVTCVWAGNVKATVDTFLNGELISTKEITLDAKRSAINLFDTDEVTLTPHSVTPYPKTSLGKIAQEDYVLNLVMGIQED